MADTSPGTDALPVYGNRSLIEHLAGIRRELHQYPELSWLEYRTTAVIAERLQRLGFAITAGADLYRQPPHNWPPDKQRRDARRQAEAELGQDHPWLAACREGYSGLVATLESGNPGPCHGFRFDIDALPINEATDPEHLPAAEGFASRHAGVMHACGHDGHITAGIGLAGKLAAELLQDPRAWCGRVHLFFQPAEEVAGGGRYFAGLPQLREVDRFATFHIGITGRREIVLDATWLAARIVDVSIHGRSSHAGNAPQEGHNALLAACTAIQNLYALPRHTGGPTRVNAGRLHSDNAHNIISDLATFRFEVRGANDPSCDDLLERAQAIIEGAAAMQNCRAETRETGRFEAQANHPELIRKLQQQLPAIGIPEGAIRTSYRVPASEDATSMSRVVQQNGGQATHLLIACDTRGGHHNPRFDFDEDLLAWAVEIFYRMVDDT